MPATRFALCEIGNNYSNKLIELGGRRENLILDNTNENLRETLKPEGVTITDDYDISEFVGSRSAFKLYRNEAVRLFKELANSPDPEISSTRYLLLRIKNNSDRIRLALSDTGEKSNNYSRSMIAKLIKDDPDNDLDLESDYSVILKLWELGTEEIAIQTIIDLDGDVTTRVLPKFSDDDSIVLHELHNASTNLSFKYWKSLIEIIKDFFESIFSKIFGPAKPQ